MASRNGGVRRPIIFWTVCPECLTYIWVEHSSISREENLDCPYCERTIPLLGGSELSDSCSRLQSLLESIERQIEDLPAAIDVHRFFSEQVDYLAQVFNDRLDAIQAEKDSTLAEGAHAGK